MLRHKKIDNNLINKLIRITEHILSDGSPRSQLHAFQMLVMNMLA